MCNKKNAGINDYSSVQGVKEFRDGSRGLSLARTLIVHGGRIRRQNAPQASGTAEINDYSSVIRWICGGTFSRKGSRLTPTPFDTSTGKPHLSVQPEGGMR